MADTALKRIEERHLKRCDTCIHGRVDDCATVKLARALDTAAKRLRYVGQYADPRLDLWRDAEKAERTLEEVGGGPKA